MVAVENNQPGLLLGQDLLHGLQVGLLSVLHNLELGDLVEQALNSLRNISGLGPLPALPPSLTGALSLENGRVLLSRL